MSFCYNHTKARNLRAFVFKLAGFYPYLRVTFPPASAYIFKATEERGFENDSPHALRGM
jgi:hypothetical protein